MLSWLENAEKGDPTAQFLVATCYLLGRGVDRDTPTAVRWFQTAATNGNVEARVQFGRLLWTGDGVPEDKREALRQWSTAAESQDPHANCYMALVFLKGDADARDWRRGLGHLAVALRDPSVFPAVEHTLGFGKGVRQLVRYGLIALLLGLLLVALVGIRAL